MISSEKSATFSESCPDGRGRRARAAPKGKPARSGYSRGRGAFRHDAKGGGALFSPCRARLADRHVYSRDLERVGDSTDGPVSPDNEITRAANVATMLQR